MRPAALALVLVSIPSCAGRGSLLPDYAEMMAVGVDPAAEAAQVESGLGSAGFTVDERAEGPGFVALGLGRASDGARAVRVVTSRGVALGLDSGTAGASMPGGEIHVRTGESGTDVDGDERIDVVVARRETDRECWLVLAVTEDGGLDPLRVDGADLDADACLEGFADVGGPPGVEALVRVRAPALRRARALVADLPLERDESGAFGRRPPPVAWLRATREALAARALAARIASDLEESYALAVEAALVARAAGESAELQLAAFDDAVASVVWTEELAVAVRAARDHVARGWR